MHPYARFGTSLREARKPMFGCLDDAAEQIGISPRTYWDYEKGKQFPDIFLAIRMASVLKAEHLFWRYLNAVFETSGVSLFSIPDNADLKTLLLMLSKEFREAEREQACLLETGYDNDITDCERPVFEKAFKEHFDMVGPLVGIMCYSEQFKNAPTAPTVEAFS